MRWILILSIVLSASLADAKPAKKTASKKPTVAKQAEVKPIAVVATATPVPVVAPKAAEPAPVAAPTSTPVVPPTTPIAVPVAEEKPAVPTVFAVNTNKSSLSYQVDHKFHTSIGISKKVEGKVALSPDGKMQIMVRAPVASFDSGNGNRDEHMLEITEGPKFPNVTYKGLGKITIPTTFPAKIPFTVDGELDFHGIKKKESIAVEMTFTSATEFTVESKFDVSLDGYQVERPSLMFVKVADACKMTLTVSLSQLPSK